MERAHFFSNSVSRKKTTIFSVEKVSWEHKPPIPICLGEIKKLGHFLPTAITPYRHTRGSHIPQHKCLFELLCCWTESPKPEASSAVVEETWKQQNIQRHPGLDRALIPNDALLLPHSSIFAQHSTFHLPLYPTIPIQRGRKEEQWSHVRQRWTAHQSADGGNGFSWPHGGASPDPITALSTLKKKLGQMIQYLVHMKLPL